MQLFVLTAESQLIQLATRLQLKLKSQKKLHLLEQPVQILIVSKLWPLNSTLAIQSVMINIALTNTITLLIHLCKIHVNKSK